MVKLYLLERLTACFSALLLNKYAGWFSPKASFPSSSQVVINFLISLQKLASIKIVLGIVPGMWLVWNGAIVSVWVLAVILQKHRSKYNASTYTLLVKWIASAGYYDTERRRKRVEQQTMRGNARVTSLLLRRNDKRKVWWDCKKKEKEIVFVLFPVQSQKQLWATGEEHLGIYRGSPEGRLLVL